MDYQGLLAMFGDRQGAQQAQGAGLYGQAATGAPTGQGYEAARMQKLQGILGMLGQQQQQQQQSQQQPQMAPPQAPMYQPTQMAMPNMGMPQRQQLGPQYGLLG